MKNKLIKIIMLLLMLLLVFSNCAVYATGDEGGESTTDPTMNPGFWRPTIEDDTAITQKAGKVLGIINIIGIISSVIILCVIGIKYMLGSVEQKAEYKKVMIPYIIGVFMLAAVTSIPNIISKITEGILG